jgi:MIP family channel proteins
MAVDNDMMVPAREFNAENFLPAELLDWIRPLVAEFIGPFALTFLGAGSIMLAVTQGYSNGGTLVMVALAHGLAIGLMIAAAGHISGGHYNPAVTIGLWLGGKIGAIKGVAYIVVQLLGSVVAALILKQLFDESNATLTNAIPSVNYGGDGDGIIVGRQNVLIIEIILTFFLMYVIYGVAVDARAARDRAARHRPHDHDGHLMGGPLSGAAMNPARHFGVAFVDGTWGDGWIYWVGPIIGASIAAILQSYVFIPRGEAEEGPKPSEHHG